jgi:hypothetical protein
VTQTFFEYARFVPGRLESERDKALTEMNGHFLSNRPIRVSLATAKKNANTTTASAVQAPHPSGKQGCWASAYAEGDGGDSIGSSNLL